jgi:HTH-type transcriptional regulator/antitoxin HigA
MNWKVIKTEKEYKKASIRLMEIFNEEDNKSIKDELELLMVLIKDYDDKNYVLPSLEPLEVIKIKMQEMGIKAKDLEPIIGSKGHISSLLSGKREITLNMAKKLVSFFNIPAEVFLQNI